jgi:predicted dehydrogenase
VTDASSRLDVAVFGTGYLGSRHAEKLAEAPGFRLTAVHDLEPARARSVAERLGCRAPGSLDEALALCDVAVIATSTDSHGEVAERALLAGKPVLVEKPITASLDGAERLVRLASQRKLVLQVGQVERFNPALRELIGTLPAPLFVESHRLASLVPRNLDLDVVQDLMVHDLDLALAFVGEEPESVEAVGVPVLTDRVDIANARLRFPSGAVANLTASRVSLERVRKFRMFLPGAYVSADCAGRRTQVFRLREQREDVLRRALATGNPIEMLQVLDRREITGDADALAAEHEAFRRAVLGEANDGVDGRQALATLRALVRVEEAVRKSAGGD